MFMKVGPSNYYMFDKDRTYNNKQDDNDGSLSPIG